MVRKAIRSSRIAEYGYDAATLTLEVAFPPSGSTGVSRVYSYAPVYQQTVSELESAASFGSAFGALVLRAPGILTTRLSDAVLEARVCE